MSTNDCASDARNSIVLTNLDGQTFEASIGGDQVVIVSKKTRYRPRFHFGWEREQGGGT